MDSAFRSAIPDLSLAAIAQLSGNSHLGFATKNTARHPGIEWSKSTLALGVPEWSGKTASGPAVAANNVPGGRERAMNWSDKNGNLWLYGGVMYGGSAFGDLWEYSPSTNMWTWVSGSSTPDMAAVYGTQGTPGVSNFPGSRSDAVGWTDNAANLWLFGGAQQDAEGIGLLNDLWRYQP
ncbi:MAG TPA: kelch repeat-containing protein [Terriglobales bacterium]|nr:kelch repeat-containing protein [Terriglobales bacterium]